jgi:glycine/D-amino acid oxidase-like deaminating enzyme
VTGSLPRISLADLDDGASWDVVVLGAGGAGMTAALSAAIDGARVLLVESSGLVGGTTSYAQGLVWIPGTHHAGFVNPAESINDARRYLEATVGSRGSTALREAFLQRGAAAVHRLERESLVSFRVARGQPDHQPECPGAAAIGRVLETAPFDARILGADFALVRPPRTSTAGTARRARSVVRRGWGCVTWPIACAMRAGLVCCAATHSWVACLPRCVSVASRCSRWRAPPA